MEMRKRNIFRQGLFCRQEMPAATGLAETEVNTKDKL